MKLITQNHPKMSSTTLAIGIVQILIFISNIKNKEHSKSIC